MAQFVKRPGGKVMARIHGYKAKTFLNMADAKLWAYEMERRKTLGDLYQEPSPNFKDWRNQYIKRHAPEWSDATKTRHRHTLVYAKALDDLTLDRVTRERVEALIADVKTHAPSTAGKLLVFIKTLLRDAEEHRHTVDTSVYSLKVPRYEKRPLRWLTWQQVEQLASWMPEFIHRIVLVAALTGMRQGELLRLEDTDLHLDEGYLWVNRGKTVNARRKVYLGGDAVRLFREQLLRRPNGSSLVFPAQQGGKQDPRDLMERFFRPAREAVGLDEHVTFHSLRHTYVSIAASRGVRSDAIAQMAGWSPKTWQTMLGHYRHFFEEEIPLEAAKMDGLLTEVRA